MVVITALWILKQSWTILAAGARQLVVQDALETTLNFDGSALYLSSFTPSTTVRSSFFAGAEMMTFLAPPFCIWTFAPGLFLAGSPLASVKMPVDSITISTPRSPH